MIETGILIIPTMPVVEIPELISAAEEIGYDYCLIADEGLMGDVYVMLGAAAKSTRRIKLGPITNGYTRHPAMTATAMATLNQLSGERAVIVLVAGGLPVLNPLGIERQAPLTVIRETIDIMRKLWSGETISWQGKRFKLEEAQLALGEQDNIPIWMAVRGPKMLELAGREADGVMVIGKSDIEPAFQIVDQGSVGRESPPKRIYKGRMAYTPEMLDEAVISHVYAAQEAPPRMLRAWGMTEQEGLQIRRAFQRGGAREAAKLISRDMIVKFQIAGSRSECVGILQDLIEQHSLDAFFLNVAMPGTHKNICEMRQVYQIIQAAC